MIHQERFTWPAFATLALVWGTSFLFLKAGVTDIPAMMFAIMQLGIGAVVMGAVMAIKRMPVPIEPESIRHLFLMGLISVAVPVALTTWGQQYITASLAATLQATSALFSVLLAWIWEADDRPTPMKLGGMLLGFAGTILILGTDLGDLKSSRTLGQLAQIGAALAYTVSASYARQDWFRRQRPVVMAWGQAVIGELILVGMALAAGQLRPVSMTTSGMVSLLGIGLLSTALAQPLVYWLLQRIRATQYALVKYLIPVIGTLSGIAIFGERVGWRLWLGLGLILLGFLGVDLTNRQGKSPRSTP